MKTLITIFASIFLFFVLTISGTALEVFDGHCGPYWRVGDANGDNLINAADAVIIEHAWDLEKERLLTRDPTQSELNFKNIGCMDINGNNVIDFFDARYIRESLAGLYTFPDMGLSTYRVKRALYCDGSRPNPYTGRALAEGVYGFLDEKRVRQIRHEQITWVTFRGQRAMSLNYNQFYTLLFKVRDDGYCAALDLNHDGANNEADLYAADALFYRPI